MIVKNCLTCKNKFKSLLISKRKYCSKKCYWKSLKNNKGYWFGRYRSEHFSKICLNCNKEFQVIYSRKDKAKFCSRKCYYKKTTNWLKGTKGLAKSNSGSFKKGNNLREKNYSWKGGIRKSGGKEQTNFTI